MLEQAFKAVGKPVPRNEDQRLITGKGGFPTISVCPAKSGRQWSARRIRMRALVSIDKSEALKMPGVLAVYTGEDCRNDGLKPFRTVRCPRPSST